MRKSTSGLSLSQKLCFLKTNWHLLQWSIKTFWVIIPLTPSFHLPICKSSYRATITFKKHLTWSKTFHHSSMDILASMSLYECRHVESNNFQYLYSNNEHKTSYLFSLSFSLVTNLTRQQQISETQLFHQTRKE